MNMIDYIEKYEYIKNNKDYFLSEELSYELSKSIELEEDLKTDLDFLKFYIEVLGYSYKYDDSEELKTEKLSKTLEYSKFYLEKNPMDENVMEIYIKALERTGQIEEAYYQLLKISDIPKLKKIVDFRIHSYVTYSLMDILEGENNYTSVLKKLGLKDMWLDKDYYTGEPIDELLENIEKDYLSFIKDDKLSTLSAFIKGYNLAIPDDKYFTYRGVAFLVFRSFLHKKYRDNSSYDEFSYIMVHEPDGDKIDAFFRVLHEYDEYIKNVRKLEKQG